MKKDNRGGSIPHPRGLIFGWGINDADYRLVIKEYRGRTEGKQNIELLWACPFYNRWKGLIERCYSQRYQKKNPTYVGCTVHEDWKYFSNFKSWMQTQDWEGKQLDKDILVRGNKVYGPTTCVFVTQELNKFFKGAYKKEGATLQGAYFRKDNSKYQVCCKQLDGTNKYLGQYDTEEEANCVWIEARKKLFQELALRQDDPKIKEAILNYYN